MKIKLPVVRNKSNGQINFTLPKKKVPQPFRDELPKLKSIEVDIKEFKLDF